MDLIISTKHKDPILDKHANPWMPQNSQLCPVFTCSYINCYLKLQVVLLLVKITQISSLTNYYTRLTASFPGQPG